MVCKNCGFENADGAGFCPQCGARVDGKKQCLQCGAWNDDGMMFCPQCGKRFDGKVVCMSCGTVLDGDAKFCYQCGAEVRGVGQSTRKVKKQAMNVNTSQIFRILTGASTLALALFAVLFTFLMRFSGQFVYAFFGSVYDNLKIFKGVTTIDGIFLKQTVLVGDLFGTIYSALTLVLVAVLGIAAIVYGVRYICGETEKTGGGFAFAAFIVYMAGVVLIKSLLTAEVKIGDTTVKPEKVLGGTTVAGIIVTCIFAAVYLGVLLTVNGKDLFSKERLLSTCFGLVGTVLLVVVFIVSSLPLFTVKSGDSSVTLHMNVIGMMGFALGIFLEGGYSTAADGRVIVDKSLHAALDRCGQLDVATLILYTLFVIALAVTFALAIRALIDGKGGSVVVAIVSTVFSLGTLILCIVTGNAMGNMFLEAVTVDGVARNSLYIGYAVPIVAFVFSVLYLIVSICAYVTSRRRVSAT